MIDSHAHLLDEKLDGEVIVKSMKEDRLEKIVNIGTSIQTSRDGVLFAQNHHGVYATVGIHPEYADDVIDKDYQVIDELAEQKKVVAIGEIGLDYHYGATDAQKEKQKEVFIRQIKIAHKHGLPIAIHCRDAAEDVLSIITQYKDYLKSGVLMHCYSEGGAYIQKFLDAGAYISFSGNITFKKVDRSFIKTIPLNKILVETDSPYLAPEPVRGTINQPKNVWHTAQKVADELEMDIENFDKLVTKNIKTFYNIKD